MCFNCYTCVTLQSRLHVFVYKSICIYIVAC